MQNSQIPSQRQPEKPSRAAKSKKDTQMTELAQLIQTDSYGEVQETLQFLLEECSLDQAPDREEIAQWRDILATRGGKFQALAQQCQQFLNELA